MKLAQVWIEHASLKLDQTYSYLCHDDALQAGMRVLINFNGKNIVGFVESVVIIIQTEKTGDALSGQCMFHGLQKQRLIG